uniref:Ig-like domain-containing protein n=1 Tax=Cyprinus carpio TaxID=7962 RepID=A0A8C2JMS5_CYPCA
LPSLLTISLSLSLSLSLSFSLLFSLPIIWTFTLVTGYSGGGVNITCRYDRKYKKKYFCRREWLTCFELIRTETKDKWVDSGRFSLFDDTRAAVFTVTFRDLSEQDSGMYWCGVEKPGLDPYTEVNLNVVTVNVNSYEGEDVSIQCRHDDEDQKSFCKAHEASMCVNDGVSLETIRDDRFSFSDEASTGVFTVNITDLSEEDSGIYWCGVNMQNVQCWGSSRTGLKTPGVREYPLCHTEGMISILTVQAPNKIQWTKMPESDSLTQVCHETVNDGVPYSQTPSSKPTRKVLSFNPFSLPYWCGCQCPSQAQISEVWSCQPTKTTYSTLRECRHW